MWQSMLIHQVVVLFSYLFTGVMMIWYTKLLTSCIMISFCGNWANRPLSCTTSRFCHKLSKRVLFLSCSWNTGGDMILDSATAVPVVTVGERFSSCRRCSISCCLEVSLYSWYRNAGGSKEENVHMSLIHMQSDIYCKIM